MKNLVILSLLIVVLSCKDNSVSNEERNAQDDKSNKESVKSYLDKSKEINKRVKELAEISPLSDEELESWLQNKVKSLDRISYKVGNMRAVGLTTLKAKYSNPNKSQTFKIEMMDGAGKSGSVTLGGVMRRLTANYDVGSDSESRKTVTKNGIKAIEIYHPKLNKSEIDFIFQDRFHIKASGENMKIDKLWEFVGEITSKNLI